MNFTFYNKQITGILVVLPENKIKFEDELSNYNFPKEKSLKLKEVMGYGERRVVEKGTCVSDLCIKGLNHLFESGALKKEDIDALILVTQTPDYVMPPTSNIIQGALSLKQDMICMDINQGCAGYIIGLYQAFMLLDYENINFETSPEHKVVLLNADIMSRRTSPMDRNSNPIVGDAASITIIEFGGSVIHANIKMDGTRSSALMIPAGGMREPLSTETSVMREDASGNFRSKNHLVMKGDEVFNFVQSEVPPMIENLLEKAGYDFGDIDYYMFHQPNRFMLNKLCLKMGIPLDKMPANIVENFGNASGVTIPTNIAFNLGERLLEKEYLICMAGFGVGLSWGSIVMNIGDLDFCKIITYP
jgi:3-oxoacyl-[acyl-carrier-protein] synthase-3